MQVNHQATGSFPNARVSLHGGTLPIDVSLISQFTPGTGDTMIRDACRRQREHANYIDALDEPSTRLADSNFAADDATALYSFSVGRSGHPFHRHAGHRLFTAISGSGGTRLRFSSATPEQLAANPNLFIETLRQIDIPADCLFTVRFGGGTWHQFLPLRDNDRHPALFALSCHTNELGGINDAALRDSIIAGQADIPGLTELLPKEVADYLDLHASRLSEVPTTTLTFRAPSGSIVSRFCSATRHWTGYLRALSRRMLPSAGFIGRRMLPINAHPELPDASLLAASFPQNFHHEDSVVLTLRSNELPTSSASQVLAQVLGGFLSCRPAGVSLLMRLRNTLVRPLQLRTSPLGCPVSSLLATESPQRFAGRYPVLDQSIDTRDTYAQVLLGADDKHLRFRSCVAVHVVGDKIHISLSTRVQCRNFFGRIYMALIARTHRRYIAPTMLSMAVSHAAEQAPAMPIAQAEGLAIRWT